MAALARLFSATTSNSIVYQCEREARGLTGWRRASERNQRKNSSFRAKLSIVFRLFNQRELRER
jgi:hypothetical protein